MNLAVLVGQITAEPESRDLASGIVALSMSVTVRNAGDKTTSVPVVWYDPPKRAISWSVGDEVTLCGRVVRRFFRGGRGLGSSTEVVVTHGELTRHRARSARVVSSAMGQLTRESV